VRYAAAHALASFGSATPEAVSILKENLAQRSWWVVAGAAASLMRAGKGADVAVPDLLALLRHGNGTVRRNSYSALEAIRPESLKDNPDAEKVRKDIDSLVPSIRSLPPEK
jgi:HEAT repeat protein